MSIETPPSSASAAAKVVQSAPIRFQFGVRHLLIAMAGLSFLCVVFANFPDWLASATLIVLSIIVADIAATVIIYDRGDARAFCIGALFLVTPLALAAEAVIMDIATGNLTGGYGNIVSKLEYSAGGMRFIVLTAGLLAPIAGAVAVIVRRRIIRQK